MLYLPRFRSSRSISTEGVKLTPPPPPVNIGLSYLFVFHSIGNDAIMVLFNLIQFNFIISTIP